ncbi:uncharacterized protein FFUJ_05145 [Fusarium fujikuroi IMI 58289]|uniref:DUF6546 domain-containing protein n=1 Tax=Gibberella fujikuroi (strain CBS 195.34 / IMI 58289 / NRRL A-6831) TaxID=1279085 RepID=S0DMN6_GIBF5|nr:uncharacterized protein FFUJ_05145 [Fusarium fujikuroi IMI 58289]CCT63701.1 uncharacterized protein FFUJ_05145 [Fusarium fujikuroi IMI 58289]SCN98502.1 uncharacterized protein FFM5_06856 [Fusarium fujikuroi]
MASWNSLPPEIRQMVLQSAISQSPFPTTPVLATVSRDWQDFFERSTFKDLALTNGDLYVFASAIRGNVTRLGYIRTLRLRINLMPYSSRSKEKTESATNITQNNRIFTQALAVLLKVLSLWRGDYGGLEVELDARSPSDCRYFAFIHELHDDFLFRFQDEDELFDAVKLFYKKRYEETKRTWGSRRSTSSNLIRTLNGETIRRLRGHHLELKPSLMNRGYPYSQVVRNLPATPIVKGLVIRRVAPRLIALESLGKIIRESFTALEYFSYSTYMKQTDDKERDFLDGLATQLLTSLPTTLTRFSYSRRPIKDSCDPWVNHRPLARLFARACHRFAEFRPPQDLRLVTFFDEIIAAGRCEESKLKKLSITSIHLHHAAEQRHVTYYLMSAARAAATMPSLRTMELWCSYPYYGILFRCEIDTYKVQITWRYLKNGPRFALEEKVVQEWEKVASARLFDVNSAPFDDTAGKWERSKILPYLHLKRLAYSPLEEAQIRAFQPGHRNCWYVPATPEYRGVY